MEPFAAIPAGLMGGLNEFQKARDTRLARERADAELLMKSEEKDYLNMLRQAQAAKLMHEATKDPNEGMIPAYLAHGVSKDDPAMNPGGKMLMYKTPQYQQAYSSRITQTKLDPNTEKAMAMGQQVLGGLRGSGASFKNWADSFKGDPGSFKSALDSAWMTASGPLNLAAPAFMQQADPQGFAYLSGVQNTLDLIARERSGAQINDSEWKSFRQQIPMPWDARQPGMVKHKLDTMVDLFRNKALGQYQQLMMQGRTQMANEFMSRLDENMERTRAELYSAYGVTMEPPAAPDMPNSYGAAPSGEPTGLENLSNEDIMRMLNATPAE
jgi:hypothetical protein